MRVSRFWGIALVGIQTAGGIVSTTHLAHAEESAVASAKERARKAPLGSEASLDHARALRRAGRDGEAHAELARIRPFVKGEVAVLTEWEMARTQIGKREFAPALATCRSIAKLPGGEPASLVCAAEAHLLWRRGTEALAELGALAKVAPAATPDVPYFAKLAEGRARELDSRDADAEAAYREAIRLSPNRVHGHVALGSLLQRTGRDGRASLRRAVEIDPRDPEAQLALGRALVVDPAERGSAIAAFERALAERPTYVEALRASTEAYLAAQRLPDAKRSAEAILKIAPNDVFSHVVAGRVALAEGSSDLAIREGEAALKLMPNEGKAKLLVADAYAKKGEIDLALEAYQKASGLDPLDPAPLVNATGACLGAGRFTSAKAFGKRAVSDFPEHAASWIAHGDALAADGDRSGARAAYASARKAKGADLRTIDTKLSRLE